MNVETGEVKRMEELTREERESGKWIPIPKGYVPKKPTTDSDHWRLERAHARRTQRAMKRRAINA